MTQRALMPDRPRGSMYEISAWRLVAYLATTLPFETVTCLSVTQYGLLGPHVLFTHLFESFMLSVIIMIII